MENFEGNEWIRYLEENINLVALVWLPLVCVKRREGNEEATVPTEAETY